MLEHLLKKTIYVWECECDPENRDVRLENPPREKQCPICKKWHIFKEEVAISPEYKHAKKQEYVDAFERYHLKKAYEKG